MDFSEYKFRCSSIGYLMTEPKTKADKEAGRLSETTRTHLIDIYISQVFGRETDLENRYIRKGLMVEEDSITLYCRIKKQFMRKNTERICNEYLQGEPDLYTGESIYKATHVPDIKSSWDIYTFFRNKVKEMDSKYYWQVLGYMAITGAQTGSIAYCLVDTPHPLISAEKNKLWYKMGGDNCDSDLYSKACEEIERNMTFDDIPIGERLIEIEFERNEEDIEKIYARVRQCREWLVSFHNSRQLSKAA